MTTQDAPSELAESPRRSPVRASVVWITVCLVLVIGAMPFLWLQVQKPRPWAPPPPEIAAQTPSQLTQNAQLLKVLSAMPRAKRLKYLFAHQQQSRQAALSSDPGQRREIYALLGEKEPAGL